MQKAAERAERWVSDCNVLARQNSVVASVRLKSQSSLHLKHYLRLCNWSDCKVGLLGEFSRAVSAVKFPC